MRLANEMRLPLVTVIVSDDDGGSGGKSQAAGAQTGCPATVDPAAFASAAACLRVYSLASMPFSSRWRYLTTGSECRLIG